MALIEILEASRAEVDPALLWGHHIDQPKTATKTDGHRFRIAGWVLGRSSPAVAVELVHHDEVIRRLPMNDLRPDLAAAFPHIPEAEHAGFTTSASLVGMGELEVGVRAVLDDQRRVPLGTIRARRRWREEGEIGSEAPLVSVVIPCYEQARFLGEAIESVLAQTYPHFEVVVVDDGSTDNTSEVATRYPGVRCVRQENRGLAGARNTGIRCTNGSFVVFLDADDRLLPDALEAGLGCFEEHPECAFVYGHYRPITADGSSLAEWSQQRVEHDQYLALLKSNYIVMHATVMYRREVFDSVGGFDTSLKACEDYDLYLRITRHFPINFHDKVIAEYHQHGANMSYGDPELMLKSAVSALRSQWKYVKGNKRYEEAYKAGMRSWYDSYSKALANEVSDHARAGEWKLALHGALALLRYSPPELVSEHRGPIQRRFRLLAPVQQTARRVVTTLQQTIGGQTEPLGASTAGGECVSRRTDELREIAYKKPKNLVEQVSHPTPDSKVVEISAIYLSELDHEQLWGRYIDSPKPDTHVEARALQVVGWVLGKSSPAVAVELIHDGNVLRRAPLNARRPDIAEAFPKVPGAENSGFRITVSAAESIPGIELEVRAVLQDRSRVSIGMIRGRRRWGGKREERADAAPVLPDTGQAANETHRNSGGQAGSTTQEAMARTHRGSAELPSPVRDSQETKALHQLLLGSRDWLQRLSGYIQASVADLKPVLASALQNKSLDIGTQAVHNGSVAPMDRVRLGILRRVTPISREFGFDRGQPIDRYYIENFLARHADDIRGRVLEIKDASYTRRYGGNRVEQSDVLDVAEDNQQATIFADLTRADHIPSDTFDCIIFTQTLQLIYDMHSAIRTLQRILKPGGVLLATLPGISQTGPAEGSEHWNWRFTTLSARRLFEECFPAEHVEVETYGNVLSASAFLYGLAAEELRREELEHHDPYYEVSITIRTTKPVDYNS